MVDLVALTATHDAVEAPAVDFDWYVPVTVTWLGTDPVLFGQSSDGDVVSMCVRWTEEERRLVLHIAR